LPGILTWRAVEPISGRRAAAGDNPTEGGDSKAMTEQTSRDLQRLASLYGVQTAYQDAFGARRAAGAEALIAVLRALGASIQEVKDAPHAIRLRELAIWRRVLDPVLPLRGRGSAVLRLPGRLRDRVLEARIRREDGAETAHEIRPAELDPLEETAIDGQAYAALKWPLPERLPDGYHSLSLEVEGIGYSSLIIRAPRRAYHPDPRAASGNWGLFAPLYALRSERNWGAGDLTDLERLMLWTGELGGGFVGTLPLFPAFLDRPYEPSPYLPVSRLFWNELYLDPAALPEFEAAPEARRIAASPEFEENVQAMRAAGRADARRLMALKRSVLEPMAAYFFHSGGGERPDFQAYLKSRPEAWDYARFRSMCALRKESWRRWPARQKRGLLDHDEGSDFQRDYHLYVQYSMQRRLERLAAGQKIDLYLDIPLGVHSDGFDTWRYQNTFVQDIAGGAPPDDFFRGGQDWGFPPLHPEAAREDGHRYFISAVRHIFKPARMARIDHVMGLHRFFWIPRGAAAADGVYVRYPADDLHAILCLESHRSRTMIFGEDLGTVPQAVREAMERNGLQRCSVLIFQMNANPEEAISPPPLESIASLNTHDTATFAGWWAGRDIDLRAELGLLEPGEKEREREGREAVKRALLEYLGRKGLLRDGRSIPAAASGSADSTETPPAGPPPEAIAVHDACLRHLADDPVHTIMVTLEDLWGELSQQNIPGTGSFERPNWSQKLRLSLEQIAADCGIVELLREIERMRSGRKGDES
jgi:4-alpha-glucanotransferase